MLRLLESTLSDNLCPAHDTHALRKVLSRSESTCASSLGGPGLKRGEQSGERSTFGTMDEKRS